MKSVFSDALYYPTIDIQNTTWLKTVMLFWDSISTIVPVSLKHPYKQYDTQYLADIGFLRPLYVNSEDKSVIGIEKDIIDIMYSSDFFNIFSNSTGIYNDKMSNKIKRYFNSGIHIDKFSHSLLCGIEQFGKHFGDSNIYYFNDDFTYIYMVILANKLCEDHCLGMITDNIPYFNVSHIARCANQTSMPVRVPREFHLKNRNPRKQQLEQGLLFNLIMKGISLSPDTSFSDIIDFKNHHHDELCRFRTQLSKMTDIFTTDEPIYIIQQEIQNLYNNEFIPAYNDFKAALTSSKIKWFTETFLKASLLSTSATSIQVALLGMPVEQALFASAGISVIASAVSYDVTKRDFLRNNPYSYLLSINREFS